MNVVIRESVESDISSLAHRLREADEKEVIAAGNESGEHALRQSFTRSTLRYSVLIGGSIVAMYGIVPESLVGEAANVWFLGSAEMSKIKKTFVKASRQVIANFLLQYPRLWNIVDGRYASSIKWLEHCGAVFHKEPIMMNGVEFYGFTIRRKS